MGSKHTTRAQDYSKWYNELVQRADLAEHSDVRGCIFFYFTPNEWLYIWPHRNDIIVVKRHIGRPVLTKIRAAN